MGELRRKVEEMDIDMQLDKIDYLLGNGRVDDVREIIPLVYRKLLKYIESGLWSEELDEHVSMMRGGSLLWLRFFSIMDDNGIPTSWFAGDE